MIVYRKEKKSDDESRKYEREKIRRQRANMTEEELQKKRDYGKEYKKRKKIADMTDREKRNVRRQVKSEVQKFRRYLKQWAVRER